jgi:hypothetical protein
MEPITHAMKGCARNEHLYIPHERGSISSLRVVGGMVNRHARDEELNRSPPTRILYDFARRLVLTLLPPTLELGMIFLVKLGAEAKPRYR